MDWKWAAACVEVGGILCRHAHSLFMPTVRGNSINENRTKGINRCASDIRYSTKHHTVFHVTCADKETTEQIFK